MLRTQSSIALASATLRSQYFRRSLRYLLFNARDKSSYYYRYYIPGYELLYLVTSFRGAQLSIAGKQRRLKRKTYRYNSQNELPKGNVRSSEVNLLVYSSIFTYPLQRARNYSAIEPLLLFGRSSFRILTLGSSYFESSVYIYINKIIYSTEQIQSKISDRRLSSLTAGRISPASIRIRTKARSSIDRKGHRPYRIAIILALSQSQLSSLSLRI